MHRTGSLSQIYAQCTLYTVHVCVCVYLYLPTSTAIAQSGSNVSFHFSIYLRSLAVKFMARRVLNVRKALNCLKWKILYIPTHCYLYLCMCNVALLAEHFDYLGQSSALERLSSLSFSLDFSPLIKSKLCWISMEIACTLGMASVQARRQ